MISFTKEDRALVVKIDGDIDHHTSIEMKDKIDDAYKKMRAKNIIFDFTSVSFMDSSGIGMVIGRYKNAKQQGGQVFVINVNSHLSKIFEISGLPKLVRTCSSLDDALSTKRPIN